MMRSHGSGAGSSRMMSRAFELARSVSGTTSPNPAVGAVIAHGPRIVGEGATQRPGGPHAEAMALRNAGDLARGATIYVTLEPCNHTGRTPPCTDALIGAGIAEVVVAVGDPDPRVSGSGLQRLREAGMVVSLGDGAAEGASHYEAYAHHRRSGRPFVTAKFAASLDGRIASTSGDSRWISGPQTLRWAHRNRPHFDAILVGVETIIVDNPQLSARPERWTGPVPQPLRVVLDSRGRTPLDAQVLEGQDVNPTLIATTEACDPSWRAAMAARDIDLAVVEAGTDGRVSLPALLTRLGQDQGVVSLLVEGGGEVLGSFFDQRLVNKVTAVVAPMLIGGDAQPAVKGRGAERMRDVLRLNRTSVETLGVDLLVTGYPSDPERELNLRVRPALTEDADTIAELLASQIPDGARLTDRLLYATRSASAVIWLAVAPPSSDADVEDIVGVGAVGFDPDGPASIRCLAARVDAPATTGERLRESCEASAAGRDAEWLSLPRTQTPALSDEACREAGFRYYRSAEDGSDMLIKRLT